MNDRKRTGTMAVRRGQHGRSTSTTDSLVSRRTLLGAAATVTGLGAFGWILGGGVDSREATAGTVRAAPSTPRTLGASRSPSLAPPSTPPPPAVHVPPSPSVAPTPSRALHLIEAERLVDHLNAPESPPENNRYKTSREPNIVTWGPGRSAWPWFNESQCASFQTAVFKHTYPRWATDAFFSAHFDSTSPTARDYYRVLAAGQAPHFRAVRRVADLRPGDLIAIDYRTSRSTNVGHVVMVRRVKDTNVAERNFSGETQYAVEIVDCTADPHGSIGADSNATYPDSRIGKSTEHGGAGYGYMMFYASNATGAFSRYRWSINSSENYRVSQRPVVAARIVPTP